MIDDVIRDLNIYFDSLNQHVELKATLGGHVNPSYLTVKYKGHETIFPFWSVSGGSEAEKRLARAFKEDIEAWINQPKAQPEPIEPEKPKRVKKATPEAA